MLAEPLLPASESDKKKSQWSKIKTAAKIALPMGQSARDFMAERGIPSTLANRLADMGIVGCMLFAFLCIGWIIQAKKAHAHAAHGEHHGEEEEEEEEEESETPFLDIQCIVASCLVLVLLTVCFEKAKHKLEHDVPHLMQHILQAMFGELAVLGFIALTAFCCVQASPDHLAPLHPSLPHPFHLKPGCRYGWRLW